MKIIRPHPDIIQILEMQPFHADLLCQLPTKMQNDDSKVTARIFPNPYPMNGELASEWREHVTPSLADHFRSFADTVRADLESIKLDETQHSTLTFPREHLDAWIHVLNQTRITLTTVHDFSEEEMELRKLPEDARACMDLYLINLFGYILGTFVEFAQDGDV